MIFTGRQREVSTLQSVDIKDKSRLSVIYGRRRVGKTFLVENAFSKRNVIKIEGLEGESTKAQKEQFIRQCRNFFPDRFRLVSATSHWTQLLVLLSECLGQEERVIFFDEFQWLANNRKQLVSALKYVWDNHFTKDNHVHMILCGSISSFIVKKVIRSKALYGRIDLEIHLQPLTISEMKTEVLKKRSVRDLFEIYFTIGGIPQYLEKFDLNRSPRLNIEQLFFSPEGYFLQEFERLFASHFGKNPTYKKILLHLAKVKFASREDLLHTLQLAEGGRLSDYLEELQLADFVEAYCPVNNPSSTALVRYRIADPYLLFYFRFIYPRAKKIKSGQQQFVPDQAYAIWQGLAFEYFCDRNHELVAKKLGFSAVRYEHGSWFKKRDMANGAQVDLLFLRSDRVITLCEVKFQSEVIGKEVIEAVQNKIRLLPNPKQLAIEPVLISVSPASSELINEGFFCAILTGEDLLDIYATGEEEKKEKPLVGTEKTEKPQINA